MVRMAATSRRTYNPCQLAWSEAWLLHGAGWTLSLCPENRAI